jgi:signal transduction histidine kinase
MNDSFLDKTILVVDDQEGIRVLFQRILKKDFKVYCASSGREAAEFLLKNEVDVIITDMVMPEMNGNELLKWISENNISSEVIVMSGFSDISAAVEAMKNGAIDFLTKPIMDMDLLRRKIRWACQKRALSKENIKLKELNEIKDKFVTMIAHELRTPISVISGYMSILKSRELSSEEQQSLLQEVYPATDRLTRVVEDILLIITTGREKSALKYSRISCSSFFQSLSNQIQYFVKKRNQTLTIELDEDIIFEADEQQMEKAVINILMNSIKFTPDKGIISLSAEKENKTILFKVKDTGIGIDPAFHKQIFESFSIIHDVMKHKSGSYEFMSYGFGVGLTVTKQVIDLHGGSIEIDSELNKGTVMKISIPLK